MGWLRQLKESYWQPSQVDQLDSKLEPLRLSDTTVAQQSPIERFVEMERDLGRLTLVTQALVEACVRKGLLSHSEISDIVGEVDLSLPTDARWGAGATERPHMTLALLGNGHAGGGAVTPSSSTGLIDDFENAAAWGNDDEPTEVEGETGLATTDAGFDFGGGPIDPNSAIDVGKDAGADGGVASIPRTAPFPKPKKRQQSSALRQVIGMGVSGVVGLGIGYFILLWFTGQDIIKAAPMLPKWMVPAAFHAKSNSTSTARSNSLGGNTTPQPPAGQIPDTSNKFGQIDGAGQGKSAGGGPVLKPAEDELMTLDQPAGNDPTGFVEPMPTDDPLVPEVSITPPVTTRKVTPKSPVEPVEEAPLVESPEGETPASTEEPEPSTELGIPTTDEPSVPFEPKQFVVVEAVAVDGQTLGEAVKTANLAIDDLKAGELTDNAAKKTKVAAFQKFCDLAKAVTFVDGEPAKEQLQTRRAGAEKVATMAVEEEAAFKDVAEIAHQWIGLKPERRTTSGVFLTGIVKDVQPAGELKLATIDLGADRIVNVVTPLNSDVVATDRVAVLGVIVEDPATELSGYDGPAGTAVWSEHVLKAELPLTPLE